MSNGYFTVQGQQNNLPLGNVNIGPLIAQCSPVSEIIALPLAPGTVTTPAPSGAAGALLVCPPSGGPATIEWGAVSASINFVATTGFAIWSFDASNYPADIVVKTTATATEITTLQFF